jgi:predicted DNA-binding transcriptional regulator AlpA
MELIDNKIYTIDDLATELRSCRKTIDRDIRRGKLPKPIRAGGKLSWIGSVLREHFENQHMKAGRK